MAQKKSTKICPKVVKSRFSKEFFLSKSLLFNSQEFFIFLQRSNILKGFLYFGLTYRRNALYFALLQLFSLLLDFLNSTTIFYSVSQIPSRIYIISKIVRLLLYYFLKYKKARHWKFCRHHMSSPDKLKISILKSWIFL